MDGGTLHAAAAMRVLGKMQDARAQNIANANTTGYRRRVVSADAFASALRKAADLTLPDYRENVDQTQGQLRATEGRYDLALEGGGFFALETKEGVRYTRNGNFGLNAEGVIVAADGSAVLGEDGPIRVDPKGGDVQVAETGTVTQDGQAKGRLRVVEFEQPSLLSPEESGRFRESPGAGAQPAVEARVRQGYLEAANVDVVDEMVQMIAGMRAFEAAQKALLGIDRVRAEAVNPRS